MGKVWSPASLFWELSQDNRTGGGSVWQGALGGRLLGIWCWGRTRRPVWVLGAEPCCIPNGDGEGCLLVAHGFKFFKLFIQQVYTKLL